MPAKNILASSTGLPVYQGGDVIIRMSNNASGIAVVHKDVLVSRSAYFARLLSGRWVQPLRKVEGTSAMTQVWELDLYFDSETKLALLTANTGNLDNTKPAITIANLHLPATDPQHSAWVRSTWDGSLPAACQFAWSDPQPVHYSKVEPRTDTGKYDFCGIGFTYLGYFESYLNTFPWLGKLLLGDGNIPGCSPEDYFEYAHLPRTVPTHKDAWSYVKSVWEALLAAMYGRKVAFDGRAPIHRTLLFLVNVLEFADFLMFDDAVKAHLPYSLLDVPDIWESIKIHPAAFLQIAHQWRIPTIYLDAARHIIGSTRLHYMKTYNIWQPTEDTQVPAWNTEMLTLLYAGSCSLKQELDQLAHNLTGAVTLCRDPKSGREYLRPKRNPAALSKKDHEVIKTYILSLIASRVLDVAYSLPLEEIWNPWSTTCYRSGEAGIDKLRALWKWLLKQTNEELEEEFGVLQLAKTSDFFPSQIRRNLRIVMNEALECIRESVLFNEPRHGLNPNIGVREDAPSKGPIHWLHRRRCHRARVESDGYFTYLNPRALFPPWSEKPWPLNENLCVHCNRPVLEKITSIPAQFVWLQSIGLGGEFQHLKMQKSIRRNRLRVETAPHDSAYEAMMLLFGADEEDTAGCEGKGIRPQPQCIGQ